MDSTQSFTAERQARPFRLSLIVAAVITVIAFAIAFGAKNAAFAADLAISAVFSIAISAVYVVIDMRFLRSARALELAGQTEEGARQMVMRIIGASIAKNFILAAVVVALVVAFRFAPVAVIIGVTINYAAFLIVPLLARKNSGEQQEPAKEHTQSQDKDA